MTTPHLVDLLYAHKICELLPIKSTIPPERFEAYSSERFIKGGISETHFLDDEAFFALCNLFGEPSRLRARIAPVETLDDSAKAMEFMLLLISHYTKQYASSIEQMTITQMEFYDRFQGDAELPPTLEAALEDPNGLQNLYEILYGGNWTRGQHLFAPNIHYIRNYIRVAHATHERQMMEIAAAEPEWACTWHLHTNNPNTRGQRCNVRVVYRAAYVHARGPIYWTALWGDVVLSQLSEARKITLPRQCRQLPPGWVKGL
ncbi:hypothetical protein FA15DRAFT_660611 [Coprinopsis marcescibilis]|uniref:Uncharacterized protein n=1 Tax=Coprinopsis marcescibilis TaxID=230819 RepID=A0A5C3KEP0_COPMA|nr:hypothetical protein FA15DRAFT_660611 [Coprinopsis marcescibilis]